MVNVVFGRMVLSFYPLYKFILLIGFEFLFAAIGPYNCAAT